MNDESLRRVLAGQTLAISALAEAFVRAGLIPAERLLSLLEDVSKELFSSLAGQPEMASLEGVLALLRTHVERCGSSPSTH